MVFLNRILTILFLFFLQRDSLQLNVLVYVDDLIISGKDNVAIQHFKAYLSTCFYMNDLVS